MKLLGVTFDNKMKWNVQANSAIAKGRKLCYGLTYLRQKLSSEQFIKVLTCQFYSTIYYGCEVWLDSLSFNDLRRLNALHYRGLRIAVRDYKKCLHRYELDEVGRARPTTWSKYQTANRIIKVVQSGLPI